jgi:hypothetical protein
MWEMRICSICGSLWCPCRFACATYGGPIATIRDERLLTEVTRLSGDGSVRPVLRIFSSSGAHLGSRLWEGGRLVGWGWSAEQELVTVEAKGKVRNGFTLAAARPNTGLRFMSSWGAVWGGHHAAADGISALSCARQVTVSSPFAEKLHEFTFGSAVEQDGVAAAITYGSGVVVITQPREQTGRSELWAIASLKEPCPVRLEQLPPAAAAELAAAAAACALPASALPANVGTTADKPASQDPLCWAVLEPAHTLSGRVEVRRIASYASRDASPLYGTRSYRYASHGQVMLSLRGALWHIDEASAVDHALAAVQAGAVHMSVSPDGAFLAVYTRESRLVVLSAGAPAVLGLCRRARLQCSHGPLCCMRRSAEASNRRGNQQCRHVAIQHALGRVGCSPPAVA